MRSFYEEFKIGASDLIFTIRSIYDKFFAVLNPKPRVLFIEDFGSTEPTDVMTDAVIKALERSGCERLIAIGGGSVIDIAKIAAAAD